MILSLISRLDCDEVNENDCRNDLKHLLYHPQRIRGVKRKYVIRNDHLMNPMNHFQSYLKSRDLKMLAFSIFYII